MAQQPRPSRPITRDDLDTELSAFKRQVLTEVDRRMSGQNEGLTAVIRVLVDQSVAKAIEPFAEVIAFARREMLKKELRKEVLSDLGESAKLSDQFASTGQKRRTVAEAWQDGRTRRFWLTVGGIISIVTALGSLGVYSALSHYRQPTQPSTSSTAR